MSATRPIECTGDRPGRPYEQWARDREAKADDYDARAADAERRGKGRQAEVWRVYAEEERLAAARELAEALRRGRAA